MAHISFLGIECTCCKSSVLLLLLFWFNTKLTLIIELGDSLYMKRNSLELLLFLFVSLPLSTSVMSGPPQRTILPDCLSNMLILTAFKQMQTFIYMCTSLCW